MYVSRDRYLGDRDADWRENLHTDQTSRQQHSTLYTATINVSLQRQTKAKYQQ